MKSKLFIPLFSFLILTTVFTPCFAVVELSIQNKLQLDSTPVDIAVSLNDKWVLVLNNQGEVLVFSRDGVLKEKIRVGKQFDQIKVGPRDDLIYLSSRQNKTIEIVALDFIQNINIAGSPYKGPVDAPVVVVEFSDYQ
jgi:hypothetical protein